MDGIHVQELICNNDIYTVCVCARVCLRVFLFIVKCAVCTKLDFRDSFPVFVDFATFSTNKPNKDLFHGYFSFKTRNQIILTKQSGRVTKILTASRILQISIAMCQIKAQIHSFPTMYIIGGGKLDLTR